MAVAKQDARAFDMTIKNSGNVVFKTPYTVSADDKTLTEHGTAAGTTEKTTVV